MKKIFVFVVICIILGFYYIFVIYKKIGPSNHAKPSKQNIQLRIKADKDIYKKDEQINITLTIKNTSQDKITLQTIPSFKLVSKKLHIWGPVNFDKEDIILGANKRSLLKLEPFEEKVFQYDLYNIKWNHSISSIWPMKELNSFIDSGKVYTLHLEVQTENKSMLFSNKCFFLIKNSAMKNAK